MNSRILFAAEGIGVFEVKADSGGTVDDIAGMFSHLTDDLPGTRCGCIVEQEAQPHHLSNGE